MLLFDDTNQDLGWDAVWEGATSIDELGWVAEFRIPFTQLRFERRDVQDWGIQVQRFVQRTQEVTYWSPTPSDRDQQVSVFGRVDGIRSIPPVRRLELMPYVVGGIHVADIVAPVAAAGLDFKYGLASNFTISGAINPDFRQVEADPEVVNLTDRETFLPEKRPFFLEGAQILRFVLTEGAISDPTEQLLYTRRIGAPPHSALDDTTDSETTIYGAAALSGKTASGLSIGALSAVTAGETGTVAASPGAADPAQVEQAAVEPLTSYNVLKVGRDANDGRTTIGGIATGVFRRLGGTAFDELHDRALTAGLTLQHRSEDGAWSSSLELITNYTELPDTNGALVDIGGWHIDQNAYVIVMSLGGMDGARQAYLEYFEGTREEGLQLLLTGQPIPPRPSEEAPSAGSWLGRGDAQLARAPPGRTRHRPVAADQHGHRVRTS
ncbi:MAG: DUF5916 domain-containing protein [Deltaproteobacteria bacterium]